MARTAIGVTSQVKCFTKDNKLIVRFRSDNPFERYEHWRIRMCFIHKEDNLPTNFRNGSLSPLTLMKAIIIYFRYRREYGRRKFTNN